MAGLQNSLIYLHNFLILLLCCIKAIAETNTLNQSDTLNSTSRLVSNNKNFTLGFVKPVSYSNNTYLAIWNSKYESPSSPVWVANRDTPITDGSDPTLFIDNNTGKLVINRTHGHPIQLCPGDETTTKNNNVNSTNTKAVLLDNGNLVLREVNSNGSVGRTLWQSFDCPTDTLLPGMKLGVNHRTGRNWSLTSWLASDDPSPGAFTLEWDPHGLELVLRRRGVVFWKSGALTDDPNDDGMTFGNIGQTTSNLIHPYKMMYRTTSDEEFFNYALKHDRLDPYTHESIVWRIDYDGSFWFENSGVPLRDYCYGYKTNRDEGCAEWEQPRCRIYNTTFELFSGYFVNKSDGSFVDVDGKRIGPADCRVSCWNDCDCQAYRKIGTLSCVQYHQDAEFRPDPSGNSPQFFVIRQPRNSFEERNKNKWIAISVPMAILLLLASVIVIIFYWRRKTKGRKKDHLHQLMTETGSLHNIDELGYDNGFSQHLKLFSFLSIVEATDNFSATNKLGQGGFGPVYKVEEAKHVFLIGTILLILRY